MSSLLMPECLFPNLSVIQNCKISVTQLHHLLQVGSHQAKRLIQHSNNQRHCGFFLTKRHAAPKTQKRIADCFPGIGALEH